MSCSSKLTPKDSRAEIYFESNSANDYSQLNAKLENHVQLLIKEKLLDFEKEHFYQTDILDSKEKAEAFAKQIAIIQFPKSKDAINKYCEVTEDKTSKLWLARIKLAESGFDIQLTLLIIKNNCKVILQSNYI